LGTGSAPPSAPKSHQSSFLFKYSSQNTANVWLNDLNMLGRLEISIAQYPQNVQLCQINLCFIIWIDKYVAIDKMVVGFFVLLLFIDFDLF
jgi:hypothetical protein